MKTQYLILIVQYLNIKKIGFGPASDRKNEHFLKRVSWGSRKSQKINNFSSRSAGAPHQTVKQLSRSKKKQEWEVENTPKCTRPN